MKGMKVALCVLLAFGFAIAACETSEDTNSTDTSTTTVPDVEIKPTQCGYDAQCVSILKPQACQRALCISGACSLETAPAEWPCTLAGAGDCEVGRCDSAQQCLPISAQDGTPCKADQWSACDGFRCQGGQCVGESIVACDDDNSCTQDSCSAADGCQHTPLTGACDDGDACTRTDTCVAGACVGGDMCECTTDSDCGELEDGDRCNGTLVCNTTTLKCEVDPATVITCEGTAEGACVTIGCNPVNGNCETVDEADYTRCEDGNVCTGCAAGNAGCSQFDFCLSGACKAGLGKPCDCTESSDCVGLDDGDACTGVWTCQTGTCALDETTVVDCSGQEAPTCHEIACAPGTGSCDAVPVTDGMACDDGDSCTDGDTCAGGTCTAGTDTCACTEDSDCESFDDGLACNGVWKCGDDSRCAFDDTAALDCSATEAGPCEVVTCSDDPMECSKVAVADGMVCDDGDSCTEGDTCAAGVCTGATDLCACAEDSDCAGFDDGNLCTGVWSCGDDMRCALDAATVVDCSGTAVPPCHEAQCNPLSGACDIKLVADGTVCDDGDVCTGGDACTFGACVPGAQNLCLCTESSECAMFDDGDMCNGVWTCGAGGQCAFDAATVVDCSGMEAPQCSQMVCNATNGMCEAQDREDGWACDDGDVCTGEDQCTGGACAGTDGVCACTENSECATFDNGDLCDGLWTCQDSKCQYDAATVVDCSGTVVGECMVPSCNPVDGMCGETPATNGTVCDDGDPCKTGDSCQVGVCTAGAANATNGTACDDGQMNTQCDLCQEGTCVGETGVCPSNK